MFLHVLHDLRLAVRSNRKRPAVALLVILTLALGIGATSAIFSIVNALLIEALPYDRPSELVYGYGASRGGDRSSVSPVDFLDYRRESRTFSSLAAHTTFGTVVLSDGGAPEVAKAPFITANLFSTLGVPPLLGRTFQPFEEQGGPSRVVVLSHRLWQRRFGGVPGVVGEKTTLDGIAYTIVGVMPPVLERTFDDDLWRPFPFNAGETAIRRVRAIRIIGRLSAGITLPHAQSELDGIAARLAATYPENESWRVRLVPYREVIVGSVGTALLYLLGAVGLVLLTACGNVANLMLARAVSRESEIAVRTALGASRLRIASQLLTESLLLGAAGGVVGLLLAVVLVEYVAPAAAGGILPRLAAGVRVDGTAVLFTAIVTLLTVVVFGLVPALHAARKDIGVAMGSSGRTTASGRHTRLRDALVVGQVALSLVLLIGAGLLFRSLWLVQRVEPGFDPGRLLTAQITLPQSKYTSRPQVARFWAMYLDRVRALPGVRAAAGGTMLPLVGWGGAGYYVEGRPPSSGAGAQTAEATVVTDDYFRTMGIPIVAGRAPGAIDRVASAEAGEGTPERGVVVISDNMAGRLFPSERAVGKRLVVDFGTPFQAEIVGIAADVRVAGQIVDAPEVMYFSQHHVAGNFDGRVMNLAVRTAADPTPLLPALRGALADLEPAVPLASVATMEQLMGKSIAEPRFRTWLLGAFAITALLLAAMGLYGVLAYIVTQRTREIGVRMALGAWQAEIFRSVIARGMLLVGVGLVIGLAGAFAVTRLIAWMLFQVGSTDPLVFASATGVLGAAGLAACLLPAWRAMRTDPVAALKEG